MCKPGDELIPCLVKAGCDEGVIEHCVTVRNVALNIATEISATGIPVNLDLVAKGAIIHDIGRSVTHGLGHADAGGEICKKLGLGKEITSIVERHIGAGLTSDERVKAGLPPGDRIPQTLEEKIVAHADNLVKGSRVMDLIEYQNSLFKFPEHIRRRFLNLSKELGSPEEKPEFSR
jgi:uncharacterized protein